MKKLINTIFACSSILFLALTGYAGLAPGKFARSAVLLLLVRLSGAGVFIGIVYYVVRLFSLGMRTGDGKRHR
jgi:hypothetical protein